MTKKVFISIALLLTYSLGFAHNFIPHSHDGEEKEHVISHDDKEHHHHHKHQTVKHLNSDHEHISHRNHYDENFYDLFVCFIQDSHNHKSNCKDQHYMPAKTNRIIVNKLQAIKLVAILYSITIETAQSELVSDNYFNSDTPYFSPLIEVISLRGPPSIS